MELDLAEKMTVDLIKEWLGNKWSFKFDKAINRFGCCWFYKKKITLSKHLVLLNTPDRVKQTILHEIAHAMTLELCNDWGHGENWKKMCHILGIEPKRCYSYKDTHTFDKYKGICIHCGQTYYRNKRQGVCRYCHGKIKWYVRTITDYTDNEIGRFISYHSVECINN